ncbi:hypothetical protein MesoLjLc_46330 [Mesorhizobium sp. L-8-10]|uniref:hypothetical protein n=1 Tax=Mesorhizobium sp. L-8-10 TaxID=2744523 RepID=UPI001925210B|nr:hypothetical protein [Mesorhizobium sp. L-8-10]BCH32703.1 hypothetical protein MesoLjLc_46330 [Mesorhizobium sp. L-8-10]
MLSGCATTTAGSLRDTVSRFVPQPAGPRRAHIRVPDPLPLHGFEGSVGAALGELRCRMRSAIDYVMGEREAAGGFNSYGNPFYLPAVERTLGISGS